MKKAIFIIGGLALAGGLAYYFWNKSKKPSPVLGSVNTTKPSATATQSGVAASSTGNIMKNAGRTTGGLTA